MRVRTRSRRLANTIAKSLAPEAAHPAGSKARVSVKVDETTLEVKIVAKDVTSLRAVLNSYLRMIGASLRVTNMIVLESPR